MTDLQPDLARLGAAHGIALEYYDIWGHRWVPPDHGVRALLRAMDVEAGDEAQVRQSLAQCDEEQAQQDALPPVAVFWSDTPEKVLATTTPLPRSRAGEGPGERDPAHWTLVEESGKRHEGAPDHGAIRLPEALPEGYHRLTLRDTAGALLASTLVVVAPRQAYLPPLLEQGRRLWGPAVQLYALRSERNWGMGDYTDLAALVRQCAAQGAAFVGLNPLHALYPHNPEHASPYSPSSRRFLNVLHLDVEAVADFAQCDAARARVLEPAFQERLRALRATELVDYAGVAAAKFPVLEELYAHFRTHELGRSGSVRAREFRDFQARGGAALRRHATFEALQEHFHALDTATWGWPQWPLAYRDPDSANVATFAQGSAARIEYYEYLQWQADVQLGAAGRAALECGLGVGLYQDLAVSVDPGGGEAWSEQDLYAEGAGVGCPPDDFNLHGQDWGLSPWKPERLRARAYAPYIAALRANMRHAGALRLDHVMGLARLFWLPRGDLPSAGSYVAYPFEDLVAILNLESRRNRCLIIGEDLGTVPDEVRHVMGRSGILSYRLLYFSQRHDGQFPSPSEFPRDAMVTAATHDQATLAGYWESRDIELRTRLNLYPSEELRQRQIEQRKRDCANLIEALRREHLLPADLADAPWPLPLTPQLALAIQEYLGRTPCRVLAVQLEDIFGCRDQVNLPGTVLQYPNWRRKLPVGLEGWERDGRFAELGRRLAADRRQ